LSDLGDTLRFSSDVRDEAGALADAQSVTLTISKPDGTSETPSVANPPTTTGKYYHDYVTTLASPAGRYVGQWVFTFSGGATTSYKETFDVVGPTLVTVDEAVAHLRAASVITSDGDLEQLQWLCQVATDAVERDLGRAILPCTVTEIHDNNNALILRRTPVISVTSVTDSGSLLPATDYTLDTDSGVLFRNWGGYFAGYRQTVTVVYQAGYLNPPPIVRKVALNTVQGMWQSSQQAPFELVDESSDFSGATVTGGLNPMEMRAYDSLRAPAIA
jgi:hypothetical protein